MEWDVCMKDSSKSRRAERTLGEGSGGESERMSSLEAL